MLLALVRHLLIWNCLSEGSEEFIVGYSSPNSIYLLESSYQVVFARHAPNLFAGQASWPDFQETLLKLVNISHHKNIEM